MICSGCGADNDFTANFCKNCGAPLTPEDSPRGCLKYILWCAMFFFIGIVVWYIKEEKANEKFLQDMESIRQIDPLEKAYGVYTGYVICYYLTTYNKLIKSRYKTRTFVTVRKYKNSISLDLGEDGFLYGEKLTNASNGWCFDISWHDKNADNCFPGYSQSTLGDTKFHGRIDITQNLLSFSYMCTSNMSAILNTIYSGEYVSESDLIKAGYRGVVFDYELYKD